MSQLGCFLFPLRIFEMCWKVVRLCYHQYKILEVQTVAKMSLDNCLLRNNEMRSGPKKKETRIISKEEEDANQEANTEEANINPVIGT